MVVQVKVKVHWKFDTVHFTWSSCSLHSLYIICCAAEAPKAYTISSNHLLSTLLHTSMCHTTTFSDGALLRYLATNLLLSTQPLRDAVGTYHLADGSIPTDAFGTFLSRTEKRRPPVLITRNRCHKYHNADATFA